jgi:DNA invertase Pin-like site-specific DNA recombinase
MKRFAAYYRVSTNKQNFGVDAQRTAVKSFVGTGCIDAEFIEIESGKNNRRPVLQDALSYCKKNKVTLVIAKLDRLSRNVAFIFSLKDAGVDFVCVDLPELNTLTLGVFASFAQFEAERISTRTKEALRARKEKGFTKTVVNNLTPDRISLGHEAIKENARTAKEVVQVLPIINSMRKEKASYREIASFLNVRQFKTRTGKDFTATQVMRIEKRF